MTIVDQYVETNASAYTERTYTATELAKAYGVTDAAVRNGWFKWISKVAPVELLKDGKQFTTLAKVLFDEFSQVDHQERPLWVADAKQRYSQEWGSVGVIDCETMPDNVSGTLALLSANNTALQADIALELTQVNDFIDSMNTADANLSEAEAQQAIARGTQRAIAEFKLEEQAKAQVKHQLHQRRLGGGAQS